MRFKGLDLNLLVALDIMLDVRSVSEAAKRLFLSQSATSGALARLRDHFGDELLIPVGRRMNLTPFAEGLVDPLRALMVQIDATVSPGQIFDPTTSKRQFRVSCSDYITEVVGSRLIPRIAHVAPGVIIDLVPPSSNVALTLESGEVDLLITPQTYASKSHPFEALYDENYVVAAWEGNTLLADGIMSTDRFRTLGHVVVRFAMVRASSHAESWLGEHVPERRIELVAPAFIHVPRLIVGTQRITIMHKRLANMHAKALPIRLFEPPFEIPRLTETVQYHRARQSDGGLKWLVGMIHDCVRDI